MRFLFAAIFLPVLVACVGQPFPKGKTIVEVGERKISEGDLKFLADINPSIARQLSSPFGKKAIVDSLVEQELLYQASKKEGLDHDPLVKAKIELYKKVILSQAYVEAMALKEAKKYFDANPQEFEKIKLSHIMIAYSGPEEIRAAKRAGKWASSMRTEEKALEEARKIYAELQAGADFAKLAKERSDDLLTKEKGGDLGEASKKDPKLSRRGLSPLLEKAFELKVGEIAGPIKTAGGYHVIAVTEPKQVSSFEEVQSQLLFKTRGEVRGKVLETLKQKKKIVYLEELNPASPEEEHKD